LSSSSSSAALDIVQHAYLLQKINFIVLYIFLASNLP
jgi:hypothetical protein